MSNIKIGDEDLVFTYKEKVFNGFAPCFDNGVYSLACCKGARNGNSLRQNACEKFLSGKTVWVLAIAAAKITDKGNNTSSIAYKRGDAIYLAKIDGVYTWKEYSDLHSDRKDSIYELRNGEVIWREGYSGPHNNDDSARATDCATEMSEMSPVEIFINKEQILISHEYYIFDQGQKLSGLDEYDLLDVPRGFGVKKGGEKRAKALRSFLVNNHQFKYTTGQDPFHNVAPKNGKCGNKCGSCR